MESNGRGDDKVFEAEPEFDEDCNPLPKFFLNLPYPYMNGYLHLGHTYSYMRGEVLARYKRMRGYNVLFPFAFHCTGSPIVSAADCRPGQRTRAQTDQDHG